MAKAMASPVAHLEPVPMDGEPRGTVRAFTTVNVIDMAGRQRCRKVSLGALHYQAMSTAKESMRSVRADNPGMQIDGQLVISL